MLNEVKHLGPERKVGIAPEGTYDGQILRSAQDDNHLMTGDRALTVRHVGVQEPWRE